MAKFRENIRKMSPYKPPLEGRSKGYLLLDFNEMTIEPSPKVKKALKEFIDSGRLRLYPEYEDLSERVAKYVGVKNSEVLVTNGADQAIDIIFRAIVGKGDKVIIPTPSFAMFYQSAALQGAEILTPYYQDDLSFPLSETLDLIDEDVRLIVICNPNNPTGAALSREELLKILKKAKEKTAAVLHDEAYFEFSGITAKDLISDYDNLFITRTLSKQFGIASVRAGYVLSQENNIEELLKIRGPYDVNMFAKTAIIAALDDVEYAKNYIQEVMEKSKPKLEKFFRDNKIKFWESAANFLLVKPADQKKVLDGLKSEGILVRKRADTNIADTIRVSIGNLEDTERFIKVYSKIVKG